MVRHVRNLDDRESPGAALNEAYAICQELHRSYEEGIGQVDWLSRLLLKKPFAELEDLCEDLALASDPEARELAAKVAAAIA